MDDRLTMVFTSLKRVESKLEQNQAKLSAIENKAVTEVNYITVILYITLYHRYFSFHATVHNFTF